MTDAQWLQLEPHLPPEKPWTGHPNAPHRRIINGILWILRTGAPWRDLPGHYPPYQTCHRRFQRWAEEGVLEEVLRALAEDLKDRGGLDLSECFVDATFVGAKKGEGRWERPGGARARSSWRWQTALVFLSPYARRALAHTKSPS